MEASEVWAARLESELREALSEAGLDWMLDEVDRAVVEGRAVLRTRRGEREAFGPEFDTRDAEVTAESYTAAERSQLLVDALRRTLVDAPALADETYELLSGPQLQEIAFVDPATGETKRTFPDENQRARARVAAARLSSLLDDIEGQLSA